MEVRKFYFGGCVSNHSPLQQLVSALRSPVQNLINGGFNKQGVIVNKLSLEDILSFESLSGVSVDETGGAR